MNDRERIVSRGPGTALLDVLRDDLGFTGTKDGCREGDCGACMVLLGEPRPDGIDYRAVNSCLLPIGETAGRHVVTIEGLSGPELSPVQAALVEAGAVQCGFCTPGLVVALTAFLLGGAPICEAEAIAVLGGNICRCTGYASIRRAIDSLCGRFRDLGPGRTKSSSARIAELVTRGVLPDHFLDASARLKGLMAETGPRLSAPERESRPTVLVAGGTDLFVTEADRLRDADLVFLSPREDLRGIRVEGGQCRIGAATPLADIASSSVIRSVVPDLPGCFVRISSLPIRNRATVAGNIINASPAGDASIIFLALDASIVLADGKRTRRLPLRDFFLDYKVLDIAAGEMIVEIDFPVPAEGSRFHFEKVARRAHMDIAGANSAIQVRAAGDRIAGAHVSAGSVAPVPLYLRKTSDFLPGRPVSAATAREAAALAASEISPISDVRGSAEYKRALLPRLILAHFLALFPDRIREEDLG